MKRISMFATVSFAAGIFFSGCARNDSLRITAVSGTAVITVSPSKGFAEAGQATSISGEQFQPQTIPADSIRVGGKAALHEAITVAGNGKFQNVTITVRDEMSSGKKDIEIAREKFSAAYTVEPVSLEYMMWGQPDELATVQEYLKKFTEKYPDINVKILHVTQQYDDKLKTMFAAHTPPDVMYIGLENFPSFVERGVFLNLRPFIDRDKKEISLDDFYPVLMKQFEYKGDYYGIAKDFTTLVLYYNKDMFDKAGVKYPNDKWTWDDFLRACQKLTKDTNGDKQPDQYGFVVETWFQEWAPWVWQNGGRLMDDGRTKWLLGAPEFKQKNAEAIQFLADLIWKHKVSPNPSVTMDMGTSDMFMTGKVAMCTYGRWMCMQFKHIKGFKWDIAVLPAGKQRAATLFTVSYAIANETKHPESSWKLIKFLISREGQTLVAESGHAIPSRRTIAGSKHFLEAKAIPLEINAKAYLDSIPYAKPTPTNPYWTEIQTVVNREMDWVWQGKETALDAIEKIQTEADSILKQHYPENK